MDLKKLEYADFAIKSLIVDRPVEKFVFHDALNGIYDFLESGKSLQEKKLIEDNFHMFQGVINILKINLSGGSCIKEIIEVNYDGFNKFIDNNIK